MKTATAKKCIVCNHPKSPYIETMNLPSFLLKCKPYLLQFHLNLASLWNILNEIYFGSSWLRFTKLEYQSFLFKQSLLVLTKCQSKTMIAYFKPWQILSQQLSFRCLFNQRFLTFFLVNLILAELLFLNKIIQSKKTRMKMNREKRKSQMIQVHFTSIT
jgi:hypothetical protein